MKKTLALVLAIVMIFALAAPVMAENTTATATGKITINNAIEGQTYKIYKIADLESYNSATNAYAYKYNTAYEAFFKSDAISGDAGYVSINNGYITWKNGADAQAFANAFITYIKGLSANNAPYAEKTATGSTVVFDNLPLGYYVIDSTAGVLCGLTTTKPTAEVNEKNTVPTLKKEVLNAATNEWVSAISAMPGEVTFKITVTVGEGAENYVIHDRMTDGLKFKEIKSVQVNEKAYTDYELKTADFTDKCAFEMSFGDLSAKDIITVEYTAVFSKTGGEAQNFAYLAYGDGQKTPEDDATVKNFGFIFVKWDGRYADITKANLKDAVLFTAQFKLLDANGNVISFVQPDEDEINACWYETTLQTLRYNVWNEATDAAEGKTKTDVIMAGLTEIKGLKAGTYYLEEIAAPDGFNKLNERLTVVVTEDGVVTIDNAGPALALDEGEAAETFVVVNNTGAELPSTGGIGTTIFYIVGGLLMVGAAVVLVSRRKVSAED